MDIRLAKEAGFCFGVEEALRKAEKALREKKGPVYSIGDIIHNPQAVEDLKRKGLKIVKLLDEIKGGTLMIRTHGVPPSFIEKARSLGIDVVDATCPFVRKAQTILRSLDGKGYSFILIGDSDHPEVKGLVGSVRDRIKVIRSKEDIEALALRGGEKIALLAQTTQAKDNLKAVAAKLLEFRPSELRIFNTICRAVSVRQDEAKNLAREVDVMVVVGGKKSANTKALADIAKAEGKPTYHIESSDELKEHHFSGRRSVGIVSGTSTPKCARDEVVSKLKGRGY